MAVNDFITTLGKALEAYVQTQEAIIQAAAENRHSEPQPVDGQPRQEGGAGNGPVSPVG